MHRVRRPWNKHLGRHLLAELRLVLNQDCSQSQMTQVIGEQCFAISFFRGWLWPCPHTCHEDVSFRKLVDFRSLLLLLRLQSLRRIELNRESVEYKLSIGHKVIWTVEMCPREYPYATLT